MELPLYRIVIDMTDPELGLSAISLVDQPAIEVPFLCFNAEHQLFKADDERHVITGPAILADTPIYRHSPQRGEYNIVFEKETIRQLVEKYSSNGLLNSVNLQHNHNSFINSAIMIESMIIDKERGLCPNEFADLPDGSWIVSYKITDDELWNEIKNSGHLNGFSVEVLSEIELVEINKETKNMNKFFKLAKMIMKLSEIATDKETLIIDGEIEVGKPVFVETEEGPVEAADGEYTIVNNAAAPNTLEDGTVLVVEAGVIVEIRPIEAPEEAEPEAEEENMEEEIEQPEEPQNDEKDALIAELEAKIAELEATIAEKDEKIAELESKVTEQEEKLKLSVETPLTKKNKTIDNKALKFFNN